MGIQSVLAQMWGWSRVLEMAQEWPWEFAVRLRPDNLYYNAIENPSTWQRGTFYAGRFASFWGVNDRFGFGDRAIMSRWLGMLSRIDEYMAAGLAFHPESLVAHAIKPCTLARTDVLFSTVRDNGILRPPQFLREIGDTSKRAEVGAAAGRVES
jgi:hypothetical protein